MHDPQFERWLAVLGVECEQDGGVTYVAGAETERGLDEVDLAWRAGAVGEQDDARVGGVVVHLRDPRPARQERCGAGNGLGAALEVDVLARERGSGSQLE